MLGTQTSREIAAKIHTNVRAVLLYPVHRHRAPHPDLDLATEYPASRLLAKERKWQYSGLHSPYELVRLFRETECENGMRQYPREMRQKSLVYREEALRSNCLC
jgi:hypothetical protein